MSNVDEHEALLQFLYLVPIGLVQTDLEGRVQLINPRTASLLLPLTPLGTLDNLFTMLQPVVPDLRQRVLDFHAEQGMVVQGLQLPLWDARGQGRTLALTLMKLDGERLMAMIDDITPILRRDRLVYRDDDTSVVPGAPVEPRLALAQLDAQGCVLRWNEGIGRMTGLQADDVCGRSLAVFYPQGAITADGVADRLREADEQGWCLDEGWRSRADGSRYWGRLLVTPLHLRGDDRVADPARYSLVLRDAGDGQSADHLQRMATRVDQLTGLGNRRAFFDAAEQELQRWQRAPRPLSLLVMEADGHDAVVARHGQPAADAVLRQLGRIITRCMRPADVVARIGADRFAVLTPSQGLDDALAAAERLRAAVQAQPTYLADITLRGTVSVGVTTMCAGVAGLDQLLQLAEGALLAARFMGRNNVQQLQLAQPQPA